MSDDSTWVFYLLLAVCNKVEKNRSTQYVKMKNILIISFSLYQNLHQCQPINYVRHPNVYPDCMIYGKVPQKNIIDPHAYSN